MPQIRRLLAAATLSLPLGLPVAAMAQSMPYTTMPSTQGFPSQSAQPGNTQPDRAQPGDRGEHYTAHGRNRPPPGYSEAPSNDITHGPDPDHLSTVQRDAVTGANLTKFGSAYGNSSPTQQGSLGDATGNGWVAPR